MNSKKDIVIPCSGSNRHIRTLPGCIEGIRRNITDEIGDIYIVAPHEIELPDKSLIYVNEEEWCGLTVREIEEYWDNVKDFKERPGWLMQQMIKLTGSRNDISDEYITVDADHYILSPHTFSENGVYNFFTRNLYMVWFEACAYKMLGKPFEFRPVQSPVTEKMIFNKEIVTEIFSKVESAFSKPLWQAAIDICTGHGKIMFSEFTLYSRYVMDTYPDKGKLVSEDFLTERYNDKADYSYESMYNKYRGVSSVTVF